MKRAVFGRAGDLWRGLQPRERLIVGVGGAFLLVVLIYALGWAPLQRELQRLRTVVPAEQEQLAWMRAQTARAGQLRGSASTLTTGSLLSFIEQSAQAYGVKQALRRVEPEGNHGARLAFESVPFDSLVGWLANLQKQGGVRVDNATIEPQPTAGAVNARLVVRTAGT